MKFKILSPGETRNMLGTKEEFERGLDEDGDDLLGDKLQAEYQEDMAYNENSGD